MAPWLVRKLCCCCRRQPKTPDAAFLTACPPSANLSFCSAVSRLDNLEQGLTGNGCSGDTDACRALLQRDIAQAAHDVRLHHSMDMAQPKTSKAWREGSAPGAKWWVRVARGQPRVETTLVGELDTATQIAELPLVKFAPQGDVLGALPTLLELEKWPQWMFMCEAGHVHRRWGPGEVLGDLIFKLPLNIRLVFTVYICLVDRLEDEGCLDLVVCSPGGTAGRPYAGFKRAGSFAGKPTAFLGVPLAPAGRLALRADCDFAQLRMRPAGGGLRHVFLPTSLAEERCPMDSIVGMIWGRIFRHLVPVLAKYSTSGTAAPRSESDVSYYRELERKILAAAKAAEAQGQQGSQQATNVELASMK